MLQFDFNLNGLEYLELPKRIHLNMYEFIFIYDHILWVFDIQQVWNYTNFCNVFNLYDCII